MPDDGDEGSVDVRLLWIDLDETPIYSANHAIAQIDDDRIVITIGASSPPVIVGDTLEERREMAEQLGYVPVRPLTRFTISRNRLAAVIAALTQTLDNWDKREGSK